MQHYYNRTPGSSAAPDRNLHVPHPAHAAAGGGVAAVAGGAIAYEQASSSIISLPAAPVPAAAARPRQLAASAASSPHTHDHLDPSSHKPSRYLEPIGVQQHAASTTHPHFDIHSSAAQPPVPVHHHHHVGGGGGGSQAQLASNGLHMHSTQTNGLGGGFQHHHHHHLSHHNGLQHPAASHSSLGGGGGGSGADARNPVDGLPARSPIFDAEVAQRINQATAIANMQQQQQQQQSQQQQQQPPPSIASQQQQQPPVGAVMPTPQQQPPTTLQQQAPILLDSDESKFAASVAAGGYGQQPPQANGTGYSPHAVTPQGSTPQSPQQSGRPGRRPNPRQPKDGTQEDPRRDASGRRVLTAAGSTYAKSLAGAIAHISRDSVCPVILAGGPEGVNQAVKAISIARDYLEENRLDIACFCESSKTREESRGLGGYRFIITKSELRRPPNQDKGADTPPAENEMKVSKDSKPAKVAGAIAKRVREHERVTISSIGPVSVYRAIQAIVTARRYLRDDSIDISFKPQFINVVLNGGVRSSALRFVIFAQQV